MTSDNCNYIELQRQYKHGHHEALSNMYELAAQISLRLCRKYYPAKDEQERQQCAHDAATYLIERYIKDDGFEVRQSVVAYLYRRVIFENQKWKINKRDQIIVYTDKLPPSIDERGKTQIVITNSKTGEYITARNYDEVRLIPAFKSLRRKKLIELIKYGGKFKEYRFDIMEA